MKQLEYNLKRYGEKLFLIVIGLTSIGMFINAFSIRGLSSATDKMGPALMPKIVFGFMSILAVLIFMDYLKNRDKVIVAKLSEKKSEEEISKEKLEAKRGLYAVAGIFLFLILLDILGFLLSSIFYLVFEFYALASNLTRRKRILLFILAVVFSCIVYYVFQYEVHVSLPTGLFDLG